jgi:hypothetical protein
MKKLFNMLSFDTDSIDNDGQLYAQGCQADLE